MEINGIGSAYSDYLTSSASQNKASALESKLDSDYSNSSDEELMEVCKEFEAYFLEQVFDAMLETTKVFSNEEESSYATKMVDYFKDSAVQELTQQATNQNGIGIAQTLYEQMKRQYSAINPASL
ncbi:MAG: rod-binding protein [Lachnospiraceae bacterium]|nr:rod-binding protein [Lachnospiraceae bacterium]